MHIIQNTHRAGIAMIELIFAIVIMGITLLSVPNLVSTGTKSVLVSFQQEAIAMAATHASALMTYPWDEQNTDSKLTYTTNILHTTTTTTLLTEAGRPTLTYSTRKRNFLAGGIASTNLGGTTDGNATVPDTNDDLDDLISTGSSLSRITTASIDEGEYIDVNISINTGVTYGDDAASYDTGTGIFAFSDPFNAASSTSSFIKLISVDLSSLSLSAELNTKQISLKAFMCNIGAANPLSKEDY